jgi:hypothetical protein
LRIPAAAISLLLAIGPACAETPQPSRPSSGVPAEETTARRQASFAADKSVAAAAHADPEAASKTAAAAFRESPGGSSPAGPAVKGFGGGSGESKAGLTRGGPQTFAASAVPSVHAAQKGVYAADDKPPPWDYDGTIKSLPFALGGAAIGFLVGGPIGACVGFLAGFFIGALLWKTGALG